ncbi:unnamed protein product, partial [Didymodactylos carnosus]
RRLVPKEKEAAMSTLYVGHLNPRTLKRDIEKLFESYGEIKQVHFKGAYAFVDFYDGHQACQCAHNLNGKTVLGERITVEHVHGSAGICYADQDRLPRHSNPPPIPSPYRSSTNGRSHRTPERERDRSYKCSSSTFSNKYTSSKQRHRESSRERKVYSGSSSSQKPAWIDKYGLPTRTAFRIVVTNLSRRVSWQDLKDLMREAGEVTYADAHRRNTHEAFVEFISCKDMQNAIKRFDCTNLKGRIIRVSQDRENAHPTSLSDFSLRESHETRNICSSSSNRHNDRSEDSNHRSSTKNLKRSYDDNGDSIPNDRKRQTIGKEKKLSTKRRSVSSRSSQSINGHDNDEYLNNGKNGVDGVAIDQNQHNGEKKKAEELLSVTVPQHESNKQEPKQAITESSDSLDDVSETKIDENTDNTDKYNAEDDDLTVSSSELSSKNQHLEDTSTNDLNSDDSVKEKNTADVLKQLKKALADFNININEQNVMDEPMGDFSTTKETPLSNQNKLTKTIEQLQRTLKKAKPLLMNLKQSNQQVIKIRFATKEDETSTTTTTTPSNTDTMTNSIDEVEKKNDEQERTISEYLPNLTGWIETDEAEDTSSKTDLLKDGQEQFNYEDNDIRQSSATTTTMFEELEDDDEKNEPLTPELELANNLYHKGIKLINETKKYHAEAYKTFLRAADLGSIEAKEELAMEHLIGEHLPLNFTRAKLYFEEGILQGSPRSHFGLSFMHSAGLIANSSIPKALVYLTFAAIDGDSLAQMALGYRYWRAVSVPHSCETALLYYKQVATEVASKITSSTGQLIQRIRLYDEEEHPSQNNIMVDDDLLQYYQLLADRGDTQAQYGLGQLYYLRDTAFDKALHYFRLAAEGGNSNAMAYLGKLFSEKNDYIKQNNITALNYFQKSAEKNNPMGQAGVGMMYYYGAGVEKNFEKALKYFQLSSNQGYVEGLLMLGIMYYNGDGVQRDYKMAVKYFNAASQSGHALGYYNLAQMHSTGTGVLRSCSTAVELFKTVAERGRWSSMFSEAYHLYKQGHIDQALGKYLFLAELGYETAQSNVAYILDQSQISIYPFKSECYRRALIYWNRAAVQGFHAARVKLGDYYFYGYGTEKSYEIAATHYKLASDQSPNPQAMFNLAYMHEKGLGLKKDIHLAKRFYDMAAETSTDAQLPVAIVLFKLHLELFWEKCRVYSESIFHFNFTSSLTSYGDVYLMAVLGALIGYLYTIRRQRANRLFMTQEPPRVDQPPPAQPPPVQNIGQ